LADKNQSTGKPKLASASKVVSKAADMETYDDVLDEDDFM
jgi:hypothetical protein